MNAPLRQPWTQDQFFSWASAQEARYEFDGLQPVGMTGGSARASAIGVNLVAALRVRLRGSDCRPLGPDAGVETINAAIRYPDALVTCSKFDLSSKTVPGVVVVFEIVSPTSGQRDRIIKVREYAAVSSIRRYVIVESTSIGLTVLDRSKQDDAWRTSVMTFDDILGLPEIGIKVPVTEIYEGITFDTENDIQL